MGTSGAGSRDKKSRERGPFVFPSVLSRVPAAPLIPSLSSGTNNLRPTVSSFTRLAGKKTRNLLFLQPYFTDFATLLASLKNPIHCVIRIVDRLLSRGCVLWCASRTETSNRKPVNPLHRSFRETNLQLHVPTRTA